MNVDISGVDAMVSEYLIYRGFTKTFQSLEYEKGKDRIKKFEVSRIVESIFTNLTSFEVENFITLWDFLNKRFFFHLTVENLALCGVLKSDLLKFYLVHAVKSKNKERITDFFSSFSHEILADDGDLIPGNLRNWYVLPYMDEPERDPEFAVHFSDHFENMLRNTLHNFLSAVLASAPPPKLLLLEKWFRSEAQQELRSQLKQSSKKIEHLVDKSKRDAERIRLLRKSIQDLIAYINRSQNATLSPSIESNLFESKDEAIKKHAMATEFGQSMRRLCTLLSQVEANDSLEGASTTDHKRQTANDAGSPAVGPNNSERIEDLEAKLLEHLGKWLDLVNS